MAAKTGLAKAAVHCSADTFVVKIATFAKPETVPPMQPTVLNHLTSTARSTSTLAIAICMTFHS